MKYTSLLKIPVLVGCFWINLAWAVDITTSIDTSNNPKKKNEVTDVNLSRLLPIAEGSTWTYDLVQSDGLAPSNTNKTVVADVGPREEIGGGCLRLQPIVFGDELVLYLGNYEDSLSLYGVYLSRWQGLEDVLLKFETRSRVDWRDFQNRYITNEITPIDESSCQDTGWGRVERTGLVLLEDMTQNLGEPGNQRGEIDCSVKNTDLRDNFSGGQNGTGLALVKGQSQTLTWVVEAMTITPENNGDLSIRMHFNPIIHSSDTDYSMYFDIRLARGGISELWITNDESNIDSGVVDDVYDLHYTQTDRNLVSPTNLAIPGGTCPEDSGRLLYLLCLLSLGLAFSGKRLRK